MTRYITIFHCLPIILDSKTISPLKGFLTLLKILLWKYIWWVSAQIWETELRDIELEQQLDPIKFGDEWRRRKLWMNKNSKESNGDILERFKNRCLNLQSLKRRLKMYSHQVLTFFSGLEDLMILHTMSTNTLKSL